MKSRLPRAAPAEPLAVRVSYLIVWTSATGALANLCPLSSRGRPSWGLVSSGQGRDSLKVVKPRWAGAETWRWVGGDKVPGMVLPLCMPLPKAWETSAAQVPPPAVPPAPPGSGQVFMVALSTAACNALVVLFAGLVAYSFQVMGSQPLTLTGSIPQGLPAFRLPPFSMVAPNGTVPFWSMVEVGARLAGGGWAPRRLLSPYSCVCWLPTQREEALLRGDPRPSVAPLTASFPPRTWGSGWPWSRSWASWRPLRLPRLLVRLHQTPTLREGVSAGGLGCRGGCCSHGGSGRDWAACIKPSS